MMTEFGKEVTGATSFIDKLSQPQFFLFVANVFFLLDSCLVVFYKKNMFDLDFVIQSHISQRPISTIVIFVISFLFIHYFLFKIVRYSLQRFIVSPIYKYIYFPFIKKDFNTDRDYRHVTAVEGKAIRNQDKFTLERVEKIKKSDFDVSMFDDEVFTFVSLLSINIWLIGSDENPTISQALINLTGQTSSIILGWIL
jgi:uncharacterized membrane protein